METEQLTNNEISEICAALAMQLHAGVDSTGALILLSEDEPRAERKAIFSEMTRRMDEGGTLHGVFRESGLFPDYVCALLQIGALTGRTENALTALAQYYEKRARLEEQVRVSLLYPLLLMLLMLIVTVVMLVWVLPIFNDVYAGLGGSLTGLAGWLLWLGLVLRKSLPVLCALLGLCVAFLIAFFVSDAFRVRLSAFWRKRLGDRGVSGKLNTARYAQALSMCVGSGLPLEDALTLSLELVRDIPVLREKYTVCMNALHGGATFSDALGDSGILPHAQSRLLGMSLKSGAGDRAMEDIAERLAGEAETALNRRVAQIEPGIVIIMSVILGTILLSVMLPLLNIMEAIG